MTALANVSTYINYTLNQVKEVRNDLSNDDNFVSKHLHSRVHYLTLGIVEALGCVVAAARTVVYTASFVAGEVLYLPVRLFDAVQYVAKTLREGAKANALTHNCAAVRLALGAVSSLTVGLLHPPANSYVHENVLFPQKPAAAV